MLFYRIFIFSLVLLIISCEEKYCEDKKTFGDNCTEPCSTNCFEEICYKNGTCEKCPLGKSGDQCELNCNSSCKACDKIDYSICTECNENYYLQDHKCLRCNDGCKEGTCKDGGICECKEGFYGSTCESKCSNCPEGGCDINGTCIIINSDCKDPKYYGPLCNQTCSPDCNNTCNRKGECYACKEKGKYGVNCDKNCKNCPGGECDMNGFCIDKEKDCENLLYFGDFCNETCNSSVNKNCNECHRNGICTSCKDNEFFGNNCTESCDKCSDGKCYINGTCQVQGKCSKEYYYGQSCNNSCEKECSTSGACDMEGKCTRCSNESYYGDKCQFNCTDKCFGDKCDINGTCITKDKCAHKYLYGKKCEDSCKKNCKDESCNMDGSCESGCSSQFYGFPSCKLECSSSCNNSNCDDDNGKCINCQDDHYYGDFCNISVSQNLKNCTRARQNGESCIECKEKKFYGEKCENECNEGCLDKKCKIDGKCEGCSAIYYGLYCNNTCDGCGNIGCDDQGYCKDFECVKGKFGLKCDGKCECGDNSNSLECGKFSQECLNCKFGYYGTQCEKRCNFKCKTGLCCLSKEKELNRKFKIDADYRYLKIYLDDKEYWVEIDYNYGFPLTLFNSTEKKTNCTYIKRELFNNMKKKEELISHYDFTDYYTIGSLFKNYEIKIENGGTVSTDIVIASEVNCRENSPKDTDKEISGVIGLGFFNSISIGLFANNSNAQNILSYSLNNNQIELLFGSLSEKQEEYIDKLTSCKVVFGSNTDIQGKKMTCELEGIKSSKHSTALKLENATITFSLREESSFVLGGNKDYMEYLKNEYLNEEYEEKNLNGTIYYKYPADKINKLPNFGFVINKYFYSYEPDKLFSEKSDENNKKTFLIGFSEKINKTEFILGKKFLQDIKFTINNEEAKIYFYAQNAEFSDKFKDYEKSNSFSLHLGARQLAAISLAIVIFFDILIFALYYCLKNRKKKSIIKIE